MHIRKDARLLRIFIGDSDMSGRTPLYEKIVLEAREAGLAGATVLKGVMGFGGTSRVLHTTKILSMSGDLPLVIEIMDDLERIEEFLPRLDAIFEESGCGGLVTLENTNVITYRAAR